MYKILIGDADERTAESIQETLKYYFDVSFKVEIAKTGKQVIEVAETFCPDILFIDLQIPGINVIEVMREVKNIHSNVNVVIVSTCVQFDYVREAVGIGVMDFMNKPLEQEETVKVLNKILSKIKMEKEKRSFDLEIKEKMEVMIPIIESSFIRSFLYGKGDEEQIFHFCELLGIQEKSGYFMMLQFQSLWEEEQSERMEEDDVYLKREWPEIKYVVNRYFQGWVSSVMEDHIMCFVPQKELDEEQEYSYYSEVMENARKMVRELKKSFKVKCKVGFGKIHKIDDLLVSYEEAKSSLSYNTTDAVVHINNIPVLCEDKREYPVQIENRLFESIECGNINETMYHMEQFFQWMTDSYQEQPMDINLKILEFVLQAEKIGFKRGSMEYPFTSHGKYLEEIVKIQNIQLLKQWSEEKIIGVCRNVRKKKEDSSIDVVKKAKQFIKLNYAKDIDLDEVSKYLQISPYYFSKLFKKKTGKNFIEYLTYVRMEQAKILLEDSSKSMKEICMEVGYCDANYFSRIFKKTVGVSPTEYKEEKYGA